MAMSREGLSWLNVGCLCAYGSDPVPNRLIDAGATVSGAQKFPFSATFDACELPDDPAAFSPTRGEEHWDVLADAY